MNKKDLREIYLEKRKQFTKDEIEYKSKEISSIFFRKYNVSKYSLIHVFLPISKFNEVNTWHIVNKLWKDFPNVKTITSVVNAELGALQHVEFNKQTKYTFDKWGIPIPDNKMLTNEKLIDLVITPLICADKENFRVGYGKGYYDKFFSKCRPDVLKVGVSMFPLIEGITDINSFDVALNDVIIA